MKVDIELPGNTSPPSPVQRAVTPSLVNAFSIVRRERDLGRSMAASFRLAHDEKIFGTGESF